MDPAATVPLGGTGLRVTRLGLGLAPIGGLFTPVTDGQATATVDRAWEQGLRLFDTAPLYGYGRSETRAGAALAAHRAGPGGPDRLMFGSDWPVCLLATPYQRVVEALAEALGELTAAERAAVWGGAAARVYRLEV